VTWLVALGGLIFGGSLPGWAIVRWVFNFIESILAESFLLQLE